MGEYIIHALFWIIGIGVGLLLITVCLTGIYFIGGIIYRLVKGLITGFKPPAENKEDT